MSNRTFTMIKPDAFSKGHSGAIIDKILKTGFRIVALKLTHLSKDKAGEFYAVHKERPFYGELVKVRLLIFSCLFWLANVVLVLGLYAIPVWFLN